MKGIISYILITFLCAPLIGQAQELKIKLKNNSEFTLADTLNIELTIKNLSSCSKLYLKPDIEFVNYGLIAIILKNEINKEEYIYFLEDGCDIDEIRLTCENSILLKKNESFSKLLNIKLNDFSPVLKKGEGYTLRLIVDYSIVDFKTNYCKQHKMFSGKLNSEIISIVIK